MRAKMIITLFLALVIALMSIQGCALKADAKILPVAQWRFIDAETMRRIEGAFVNFAWRAKPTDRGLQTCKRGILGRSDKEGWFRDIALDASWREDPIPAFFVPGYEFLDFKYGYPDKGHITAYIAQDSNQEHGRYPGFEKRWADMGYIYQGVNSTAYLQWQAWTKVMPAAGFHDRTRDYINNNPRRYFVKIRSAPADAEVAFAFVGKVCSDDGSTNQVDKNIVREADYLRGYHSTKYF